MRESPHWNDPNDPPEEDETADGMSLLDHLEDLRRTFAKSFIAFGAAAVLIGVFLGHFSGMLQWPYNFATADMDLQMEGLINTSILGVFSVVFYLLLGGGLALSLPFMLYFVGQFVAPGLNEKELRLLRPACFGAFTLFITGATFSFFILVPAALRASILFNQMLGFTPMWTADSYYGLLTWMVLGVGIAFQFPLVLIILIFLEIITAIQLVQFRRYSIILFLCIGAMVTPTTDPVTFLLLALPMSLLYELAIIGGRRLERRRETE